MKQQFSNWINQNQLLYFSIVKPKTGRKTIWGRILMYDVEKESLLVYDDDEKSTIHIMINEIEELVPSSTHRK